jgi:ribosomal subunit interface protein
MKILYSVLGLELTGELNKYANGKVKRLTRRIPRKLRAQAECQVEFAQAVRKGVKYSTCSVTLMFDDTVFRAKETTQHMYAALDIAAVQIEQQVKDHARSQHSGLLKRRFRTG